MPVTFAQYLVSTRLIAGSSAVLMLYDHALSLGTEVDRVWHGKWTLLSVIMMVDIYVREIGLVLLAIATSGAIDFGSVERCTSLLIFILFYGMLIAASVNSIILYRVYTLWDDRKNISRALIGGFVCCYAVTLVFAVLTGIHLSPGMQYLVSINACSFARKSFYTSVTWSGIVLYDLCVLVLLFVRILGSPRRQNSQFVEMLYRDGFLTFLGFFVLRIARLLSSILMDAEGVMIVPLTTWALDGALSRHIFLRVKRGDVTDGTTYVWQPQDSSERSGMLGRISAVQVWEEVEMQTI